jgi:hypothetical protein
MTRNHANTHLSYPLTTFTGLRLDRGQALIAVRALAAFLARSSRGHALDFCGPSH